MEHSMIEQRNQILNGNLFKILIILGLPIIFNNFIQAVYEILDIYFISNAGDDAIAAITFVGPMNNVVFSVGVGFGVAGTALIAHAIGKGNLKLAKQFTGTLLGVSFIVGIIVGIIGYFYSAPIMSTFSATPNIVMNADLYFKISMLTTPITLLANSYTAIKYAEGSTKKMFYINTLSIMIKLVFNVMFILLFNKGIVYLGISTFISRLFIVLFGMYDLFLQRNGNALTFKDLEINPPRILRLIRLSFPVIIEKTTMSFGFIVMNVYVLSYGESFLSAYGVASRITSIGFSTVGGLAGAVVTIVAQNLAVKNYKRIQSTYYLANLLIIGLGTLISIFVVLYANEITALLVPKGTLVYTYTVHGIRLFVYASIPFGILQVVVSMFQASYKNIFPLLLSIARLWVFRIPIVYYFIHFTHSMENSIWYGMIMSNVTTAIFGLILYYLFGIKQDDSNDLSCD